MALPEEPGSSVTELGEDEVFVFPVSFAQQRLWVLDRLDPNSAVYNIPIPLRLAGELNVNALRDSLTAIVQRHEVLRSTFGEQDGSPVQIVPPSTSVLLAFTDLSELPLQEREQRAGDLARMDAQKPFDLSRGPIFRAWLLRLDNRDHLLLLNVHHIVFDGWSRSILLQELVSHYFAFVGNKRPSVPELAIQYSDYAIWQRKNLSGEKLTKQIEHWRQQLAGAPASLDLATDHARPPMQTFNGAHHILLLSRALRDALHELSQHESATFFMTLLAAFNVLLARYTGQEDIVVGSPIAGRSRPEVEGLIGFFVNMLPLRTDLSGAPTFRELLVRVRETCLKAYAHQDLPFEKLVEELKPERDASRNPIFQVMFALQNMGQDEYPDTHLRMKPFSTGERMTAKFDLSLYVIETREGLRLAFEYNTDLFDEGTIERMAQHFKVLLEAITVDADQRVTDLRMLTEAESQQILRQWNETESSYPHACIHELFETQVQLTPDAVALVFNDVAVTYRELNQRANQLAHHLRRLGVTSEQLVGVSMERSSDMVVALLAVLKAGGAYVPLDPAYPKERLSFMLRDCGASLVLTSGHNSEWFPSAVRQVDLHRESSNLGRESVQNPANTLKQDTLAYVIYTSGSTGQPKGVLGTHKGAVNRFNWMWQSYPFEAGETCCQKTSLNFVDSVWEIFGPLLQGVKTVIVPDPILKDPSFLVPYLASHEVTRIVLVPSLLRTILETIPELPNMLPRLKYWVTSGEALTQDLVDKFLKTLPDAILLNVYGSTEVSADCTCYQVNKGESLGCVPIGKPLFNTQAYVLDRNQQVLPIGVPGELYVGGDGLARGYLQRPELTAERFIPNPFSENPEARLFKTGDLARLLPDGNIEYLGRSDFQVKLRGFRIELGEVESALATHPAIKQSVVVLHEDLPRGSRLIAYFVSVEGEEVSREELRSHLKRSLPEHMVPSSFVQLSALPLTPNGKVNRRALPLIETRIAEDVVSIGPRNDLEATLLRIWQELLGVESLRVTDNFFEIGGHSLLAVRLVNEIHKATGKHIPLAALFQSSTIQSLARVLSAESMAPEQIVLQIQGKGSKPPFFGIVVPGMNALGFVTLARHLGKDQPFYRIQQPGPRLRGRPYTAVEFENLASDYVRAMKGVQPHGPYYLGGMCEGARIAFDMARLLERQGEAVGLLAIFDTWVLENSQIRALWKIDYYTDRLKKFWRLPRGERQEVLRKALRDRVNHLHGAAMNGKKASVNSWPATYWPGKSFVPAKFGGKITLLKRRKQPYYYVQDPLLGWGTRTTAQVEVHSIDPFPSRHLFIFRDPYVAQVGQQLLDCLERARNTPSLPAPQDWVLGSAAS